MRLTSQAALDFRLGALRGTPKWHIAFIGPMTTGGNLDEQQVKHLEMIQGVVARLGNNAFFIKGWAITITAALVGFAVDRDQWELAAASVVPTGLFWILDASFLRNERLFRNLFGRVVEGQEEPFFMNATSDTFVKRVTKEAKQGEIPDASSRLTAFLSETLRLFYGAVIGMALIAAVVICRA